MLCDYGCGKEGKYYFKTVKKWCCSDHYLKCESNKEKRSGKNSWRLGVKHTSAVKIKCGIKNIGRKLSEEHKRKIIHYGKDNPSWKGGYSNKNLSRYDKFATQLEICEEIRRNKNDSNILEARCNYCGKWFKPTPISCYDRVRCLNGTAYGEGRLYCSEQCKQECPIYNQTLYPKGFKPATSREVQPELRQMRFEIDNYTCQKCKKIQDELDVALHCHHIEGIKWDPLESADVDKVITLCKNCHIEVHKQEDCKYSDMKCS